MMKHATQYTEDDDIKRLLLSGDVRAYPASLSKRAFSHLAAVYPLNSMATTTILDWPKINHLELKWCEFDDDEVFSWTRGTLLKSHSFGLLVYSEFSDCLFGKLSFVMKNLDILTSCAPGPRLVFAVDVLADDVIVFTHGILETNGLDRLFAPI